MHKYILTVILCGIISSVAVGQDSTPFQTWSIAEIGYGIDDFDIKANYQMRHSYNPALLERRFAEVGVSYKIVKDLKVGSVFRFGKDRRKDEFNPFNRIALLTQYSYEIKRWTLKPRIQWQYQTKRVEDEQDIVDKFRFRLASEYNIKFWKFDPMAAVEYFVSSPADEVYASEKLRFTIGTEREIIDNLSIKVAYRYELALPEDSDVTDNLNILQVEVNYSF